MRRSSRQSNRPRPRHDVEVGDRSADRVGEHRHLPPELHRRRIWHETWSAAPASIDRPQAPLEHGHATLDPRKSARRHPRLGSPRLLTRQSKMAQITPGRVCNQPRASRRRRFFPGKCLALAGPQEPHRACLPSRVGEGHRESSVAALRCSRLDVVIVTPCRRRRYGRQS